MKVKKEKEKASDGKTIKREIIDDGARPSNPKQVENSNQKQKPKRIQEGGNTQRTDCWKWSKTQNLVLKIKSTTKTHTRKALVMINEQ